ncbi:B-cell receptor-associated 31-like protein [Cynara cardunculus var. scolymus]|uniref:Endoplasmic reticulum transmembrane protein n=1 Tax=Cynara cardunculus var. scolymus TaxID=59895 RepID=A0A103YHX7_CYNCS|nr:B-cell receptor-associated 31-like protein [Cynara cardunculus var. scolymus]
MIQILFTLIFAEMALIVIFVFKTPLRKLVIMGLDRVKRGQAPLVVKAVGSTIFVVMMSSVYSVIRIHNRGNRDDGDGELTPTDQILAARHLLEASLMELRIRRKNMDAIKKQNRIIENGKNGSQDEVKALEGELTTLKEKLSRLESELDEKTKDASNAEANAIALKKQSEGFLLEYDRLLEDNQNLRAQLQSLDRRLSHSGGKKVT